MDLFTVLLDLRNLFTMLKQITHLDMFKIMGVLPVADEPAIRDRSPKNVYQEIHQELLRGKTFEEIDFSQLLHCHLDRNEMTEEELSLTCSVQYVLHRAIRVAVRSRPELLEGRMAKRVFVNSYAAFFHLNGFTLEDMIRRNYEYLASQGRYPGFTPPQGSDARSTSSQGGAGGSTSSQARDGGPTSSQAREGGSTSSQAREGGSTSSQARDGRPTSSQARDGGPTSSQARDGGPTSSHARNGGPTSSQARDGRPTSSQARDGGSISSQSKSVGSASSQSIDAVFSLFQDAGFTSSFLGSDTGFTSSQSGQAHLTGVFTTTVQNKSETGSILSTSSESGPEKKGICQWKSRFSGIRRDQNAAKGKEKRVETKSKGMNKTFQMKLRSSGKCSATKNTKNEQSKISKAKKSHLSSDKKDGKPNKCNSKRGRKCN